MTNQAVTRELVREAFGSFLALEGEFDAKARQIVRHMLAPQSEAAVELDRQCVLRFIGCQDIDDVRSLPDEFLERMRILALSKLCELVRDFSET